MIKIMNSERTLPALLILTLFLSLVPLSGTAAQERDSGRPRVRIGLYTFAPLSFTDEYGRANGLFPSLASEIVKEEGWRVSYLEGSWDQMLDKLENGEIDLLMPIKPSPGRELAMDFNRESVVEIWGQVFIPPGSGIQTMKDLDDKHVAVLDIEANSRNLVVEAAESGVNVIIEIYSTLEEVMDALEKSEVQAFAAPQYLGLNELRDFNLIGTNILFSPFPVHFAVKKGENARLLEDIDRNLELWKRDNKSVYYKLIEEWMTPEHPQVTVIPFWVKVFIPLCILGFLIFSIVSIYMKETIKRRTDEIRSALSNYRSLVQQLQAIVMRINTQGRIIMINSYGLSLIERREEDLEGSTIFELDLLPASISSAELDGSAPWKDLETLSCVKTSRGDQYVKWSINRVVTRVDNTPSTEILCIGIDITDQIESERALQRSELQFQSFMSNIPVFAYMKDENRQPLFFNKALQELIGNTEKDMKQKDFIVDSRMKEKLKQAEDNLFTQKSEKESLEYEIQVPGEKSPRYFHELMFPIKREDGTLYLGGVGMDLTESRAIEEQLNQSRKMQAIGELAGGIAHDFNNQLAGILGYTDLITSGISDARRERYAQKLKTAVERASEVTSQLLSFSRKGKKENRQIDVNGIIDELISLLSHSLNKQIHIHFDERCEESQIMGDPGLIQNALLNIAINARDAMNNKGDLYFTSSNITVDEKMSALQGYAIPPGPYLKVSIEDTGEGMSREVREKIFEPFFTTKEEGKGTGMGLSMVYGTVKEHRGNITVQSTPGQGTVFNLYFPVEKSTEQKASRKGNSEPSLGSYSIAVVDDETMIRDFLRISLKDRGHRVSLFKNGLSFLESLDRGEGFDLVILDMIMPEMSGVECYRELKKRESGIRVLLSSGYSRKEDVREIMKNDRVLYLQKPYSIQDLIKAIQELMTE